MIKWFHTLFKSDTALRKRVEEINALEPEMQKCSDNELRTKSGELRERAQGGSPSRGAMAERVEPPAVSDAEPPIVMPLGANPTTVNKGDTYIDPGVTVSDNVDQGLSYTVSVDGLAPTDPSSLSLDTTTLVAHTLTFSATDNAGNVGIATRTVQVVESVLAPPEPSPEP